MKKNDFLVSVILLTHNQSDILKMQIYALEHQIGVKTSEFEVIITDDSSHQKEIEKIENIITKTFLICKFVKQKSDRYWASRARNNAIEIAKGKLLIFLDGDMIPEVDLVYKHLLLQSDQSNHIVAGQRIRKNIDFDGINYSEIINLCRKNNNSDPIVEQRQKKEELKRLEFMNSNNPWRVVFSCNMSIQSSPDVRFDENFKGWGPEDWELSYRLSQINNYSIEFNSNIIAYEVDHLGNGVGNIFRFNTEQSIIDYLRNMLYFFDKCHLREKEEVFWGFRKLKLQGNKWVVSSVKNECDIDELISKVRNWLDINDHYKFST